MLDTSHRVETPEGVRLVLRPAGPVARGLAWSVDVSIRSLVYMVVGTAVGIGLPDLAFALIALTVFAGEWAYPVLFEMLWSGRTPGKASVGLRVVNDDGTPVNWSSSVLRNLLLAADFLPGTYGAALVSMLVTRDFRRLGDLAAGTWVVHDPAPAPGEPDVPLPHTPLAPPFHLELEEQRAVISFTERAGTLSEARADELASLVPDLGGGEPARQRLARVGAWLIGRRAAESAP